MRTLTDVTPRRAAARRRSRSTASSSHTSGERSTLPRPSWSSRLQTAGCIRSAPNSSSCSDARCGVHPSSRASFTSAAARAGRDDRGVTDLDRRDRDQLQLDGRRGSSGDSLARRRLTDRKGCRPTRHRPKVCLLCPNGVRGGRNAAEVGPAIGPRWDHPHAMYVNVHPANRGPQRRTNPHDEMSQPR